MFNYAPYCRRCGRAKACRGNVINYRKSSNLIIERSISSCFSRPVPFWAKWCIHTSIAKTNKQAHLNNSKQKQKQTKYIVSDSLKNYIQKIRRKILNEQYINGSSRWTNWSRMNSNYIVLGRLIVECEFRIQCFWAGDRLAFNFYFCHWIIQLPKCTQFMANINVYFHRLSLDRKISSKRWNQFW